MQDPKKYLVNSQKAISETIDGETIIINLETGSYYSMNLSGTALWQAISSGKTIPHDNQMVIDFIKVLLDDNLIIETADINSEIADSSLFNSPTIEIYTDMQEMLLADPIHDVETAGWPNLKKED